LSGSVLPKSCYDPVLQSSIGQEIEQSSYMGVYSVRWCEQEEPMEPSSILQMMEHYKEYYPHIKGTQLRFHLECCKKCCLVPNKDYPTRAGGYRHLEVDVRDKRKPLYEIQRGVTIESVLNVFQQSSASPVPFASQRTMLQEWVCEKGYLELVKSPFVNTNIPEEQENESMDVESVLGDKIQQFQPATVPVAYISSSMAVHQKRTQNSTDHMFNLLRTSIGVFSRISLLNINAQNRIGPLIDSEKTIHTGVNGLLHYERVFWEGKNTEYLSHLGREVQVSPTTHPIRTYDPKVLLLMSSNGGPKKRENRKGLPWVVTNYEVAADLFFQCIIIEVVKVEVLLEWSACFHTNQKIQLPCLSNIPSFLEFILAVLDKEGWTTTRWILHDQYQLNDNLKQVPVFRRFFTYLQTYLPSWFEKVVSKISEEEDAASIHLFINVNKQLTSFLEATGGLGDTTSKQPFHCQHILLDWNEVVSDFPFGQPFVPIFGFGGIFGAQLLQEKTFLPSNQSMVMKTVNELLRNYSDQKASHLHMMGLKRLDVDGTVVVSINNRPLGTCDAEHGCCINFVVLERGTGGTKGLSSKPKLSSRYCHGINGTGFLIEESKIALASFIEEVDSDFWPGKEHPEDVGCPSELNRTEGQTTDGNKDGQDGVLQKDVTIKRRSKRPRSIEVDDGIGENSTARTQDNHYRSPDNPYIPPLSQCNLMLGMIYGNFEGTPDEIGKMNQFTTQLRRDTARCIMTEKLCKKDVYTLDNRTGDGVVNRQDRHVVQDMQRLSLDHPILQAMLGRVSQICLDHFWFVGLYWVDKAITKGFICTSLPKMHDLLVPQGAIYFGMSVHIFCQLVKYEVQTSTFFTMSLVHANDVEEIDLVKGSHAIPDHLYSSSEVFGKKNQCPESKLGLTKKEIQQTVAEDMGMMQVL
jgi:hypothetical protein